jgi:hypothetical protein
MAFEGELVSHTAGTSNIFRSNSTLRIATATTYQLTNTYLKRRSSHSLAKSSTVCDSLPACLTVFVASTKLLGRCLDMFSLENMKEIDTRAYGDDPSSKLLDAPRY